nr:nodulation protein [Melilotus officinalis]
MKWAVAEPVVYGVVVIIAVIAIVYAIIECLKKAGTIMSAYTQISTTERDNQIFSNSFPSKADDFPIRFTPEQLDEITNKCNTTSFRSGRMRNYSTILRSGASGNDFKGELSNGEKVAVKVFLGFEMAMEEQFKADVSTIGRNYHINIVKVYGFCLHPDKQALVYEYLENGSLAKYLFDSKNRDDFDFEKLHEIAIGIAKGIAYLHEECENRIIHYDIRPENILLDKEFVPKVADIGLSKFRSRESHIAMNIRFKGKAAYAAPEMWKAYPETYKCDVYSFGILLFEIVGRRRRFDSRYSESQKWFSKRTWELFENNELVVMLELCGIEEKDHEIAERMLKVAQWCVQYSPHDRPLMSTIVKMLEGEIEISPPPFPFNNLVPAKENLTQEGSTVNSDTTTTSWNTESFRESGSTTKHNTFQIEKRT